MSSPAPLPPNIHISTHPLLHVKLSQLRSHTTTSKETKQLVHDIALILGVEALGATLHTAPAEKDTTPLGYEYVTEKVTPERISVMPVLRSGLGMVDAIQQLLPAPTPTHHLGLFRDPTTLSAVEYYNNLPYHHKSSSSITTTTTTSSALPSHPPQGTPIDSTPSDLTLLLDPIIATGATACAAIDTLRDWGTKRVVMLSILASRAGMIRAAEEWSDSDTDQDDGRDHGGNRGKYKVEFYVGAIDEHCDERGMIVPGVGDVGDRLFMAIGK